jgi:hypothetical protein
MANHEWPDAVVVAYSPSSAAVATGLKLHRIPVFQSIIILAPILAQPLNSGE